MTKQNLYFLLWSPQTVRIDRNLKRYGMQLKKLMEEKKLKILEEIKAMNKMILVLCLAAFAGLIIMQMGDDIGYAGLGLAIVAAVLAVIIKLSGKKKAKAAVNCEDVKITKIS